MESFAATASRPLVHAEHCGKEAEEGRGTREGGAVGGQAGQERTSTDQVRLLLLLYRTHEPLPPRPQESPAIPFEGLDGQRRRQVQEGFRFSAYVGTCPSASAWTAEAPNSGPDAPSVATLGVPGALITRWERAWADVRHAL